MCRGEEVKGGEAILQHQRAIWVEMKGEVEAPVVGQAPVIGVTACGVTVPPGQLG